MGNQVLTSWAPASSPEFRAYLKQAKAAATKGDPDPSKSNKAPACFEAVCQMALDQLHHQAGFLLDDIQPDRETVAGLAHVEEQVASGAELTEDLERQIMHVRQARQRILGRVQRFETERESIQANWARMDREMQQEYRRYYPYANHIGELIFPKLDLASIWYGDEGGFGLAALLPKQPTGGQHGSAVIKKALGR